MLLAGLVAWRWYSDHHATRPGELISAAQVTRPVDLNRAERQELLQLPGVGPKLADHILAYRKSHGPFLRVDDLDGIQGIGQGTLSQLRPWLRVDPVSGEEPSEPDIEPARLIRKPQAHQAPESPQLINVNRATAEELQSLPGIGRVLAQRIVDEREKQPFARVEDLRRVSGIGPKTMEKLRPHVAFGP